MHQIKQAFEGSKPVQLVFLVVIMFWLMFRAFDLSHNISSSQFIDSYEYYAAYALIGDANPYDATAISLKQQELGLVTKLPIMMWNPPWTFIVIWPLVQLDFDSYRVWLLIINLLIPLISVLLFWSSLKKQGLPPKLLIIGTYLFYPVIDCISYGQISLIVSLGAFLLLWGLSRGSLVVIALSIPFLLIKPHFTAIFLATVLAWLLLNSKKKYFVVTVLSSLITVITSELLWPGSFAQWVEVLLRPASNDITLTPFGWHTASLTHWLVDKFYLSRETLSFAMFVLGLLSSIVVFKMRGSKPYQVIAIASFIALIFSPFVWLFDMTLLLIVQVSLMYLMMEAKQKFLIFCLIIFQLISMMAGEYFNLAQHDFSWFLMVYIALAAVVITAAKKCVCLNQ